MSNQKPPKKKFTKDEVDLLRAKIHTIIRYDQYIQVAAMLWDEGVRYDSLAGKETLSRALCSSGGVIGAVPEPYAVNAINYLRQWEQKHLGGPEIGPDASIPRWSYPDSETKNKIRRAKYDKKRRATEKKKRK